MDSVLDMLAQEFGEAGLAAHVRGTRLSEEDDPGYYIGIDKPDGMSVTVDVMSVTIEGLKVEVWDRRVECAYYEMHQKRTVGRFDLAEPDSLTKLIALLWGRL